MLIGLLENGGKCIYDLPDKLTPDQFSALITGLNEKPGQREELQGQPILKGYNGPMFNGYGTLKSTGEQITIIRYEK